MMSIRLYPTIFRFQILCRWWIAFFVLSYIEGTCRLYVVCHSKTSVFLNAVRSDEACSINWHVEFLIVLHVALPVRAHIVSPYSISLIKLFTCVRTYTVWELGKSVFKTGLFIRNKHWNPFLLLGNGRLSELIAKAELSSWATDWCAKFAFSSDVYSSLVHHLAGKTLTCLWYFSRVYWFLIKRIVVFRILVCRN